MVVFREFVVPIATLKNLRTFALSGIPKNAVFIGVYKIPKCIKILWYPEFCVLWYISLATPFCPAQYKYYP